jgi:hypothetical protein
LVHGQISQLDPTNRLAVIRLDDGREVSVTFPEDANIEVFEPTTLGTMGGTLDDLRVGYWVEAEVDERGGASCACTSLHCLS